MKILYLVIPCYNEEKTIRKVVTEYFSQKAGDEIKIVYGGSVSSKNLASILRINTIGGTLVGGASLDANSFAQMLSQIN